MDLNGHSRYSEVICKSGMWPDIILHSWLMKQVVLLKLSVPWKSKTEEQHIFKLVEYGELIAGLRRDGHPTRQTSRTRQGCERSGCQFGI